MLENKYCDHKSNVNRNHHKARNRINYHNEKNLDRTSNDFKLQLKEMLLVECITRVCIGK